MVAGGLPTIQVLMDDGSGSFPYDVTTRVRLADSIKITRGREDEQSDVSPGQCMFTLENTDGGVTLGSTVIGSPSPVVIDNRLRVKYTPTGQATINRHTGYLTAEPVAWPTGSDLESRVAVTLVDAQARAERHTMSVGLAEEILAANPDGYWPLSDPAAATTAADFSGGQNSLVQTGFGTAGATTAVVFGSTSTPGTTDSPAATFANGKYLVPQTGFVGATATPAYAVAFATTATNVSILGTEFGTSELSVSAGGALSFGGSSFGVVNDGLPHFAAVRFTVSAIEVYLDGALAGTIPGGAITFPGVYVGADVKNTGTAGFTGNIAHVAFWKTAPTAAQMLSISSGGADRYAELTSARVSRFAAYANIPTGTIDAGLTTLPVQATIGSSVSDGMNQAKAAEGGIAYVNGSGAVDFHNRNRAVNKTSPDATIAAEFLAEDTAFQVDTQGVINFFETTSSVTGVTQVVRNTVSELGDGTVTHPGHGRYPGSASYLVSTDAEALDRASWIVANHAEPQPRAGTLTFDLLTMTAAQQAQMLALEADSWIEVTGLPSQTPGGTTGDFIVQGLADTLTLTTWTLALNVVSRSLFSPVWILGDTTYSVLGSTTRLYF